MILPTKRLNQDKALLTVGADILQLLDEPKTVSRLWTESKNTRIGQPGKLTITYDWFVLALALLYSIGIVEAHEGRIRRRKP
jgi:ABC-3C biological conflict system middle component